MARRRGAGAFTALRATFPRSALLPLRLFALSRQGGALSGCGRVLCPSGDVSALRSPAFAPFCAVVSGWRVVGGRARSLPFGRRFRAPPSCLCAILRCRVGVARH